MRSGIYLWRRRDFVVTPPVDNQGIATIDRLHTGNYNLHVYAENDGYSNFWYSINDEERTTIALNENTLLNIELYPGSNLAGQIIDDMGKAVYGADILVFNDTDTKRARSDRFGNYQVWGLYEGDWQIEISYVPLCTNDRSYVPIYHPSTPNPQQSQPISILAGDQELNFVLPIDNDHDGMSDAWESTHQLDPNRNDASEDPDQDGLNNLEEYYNDGDPNTLPPSKCGCGGTSSILVFLPLWLGWRRRSS